MIESPLFLEAHLVEKIWGGQRLAALKGLPPGRKLGESWEISALAEGPSKSGGKALDIPLPYLVKLIDTTDHLSVQVHPTDEYAQAQGLGRGKSECWLILDAAPGAGLFLGFRPGVTKGLFRKAVVDGEDVSQYLEFYPVSRGDFFWAPAGAVHALGAGVLLAEVQQSSGHTFRVWDWNRVDDKGKPRELHVERAFDVLDFSPEFNQKLKAGRVRDVFSKPGRLLQHPDFEVHLMHSGPLQSVLGRPIGLLGLEGLAQIPGVGNLAPYQALLLPPQKKWALEKKALGSVVLVIK